MEQFGCRYLFETGTGIGDGLAYASYYAFERLWSVEIHPEIAATARDRFIGDARIEILQQTSEAALSALLPSIDRDKPILFWLDAHFYGEEKDLDRRLPLERELALIGKLRHPCRDVILIDDLRIYEDGAYEMGPMPDWAQTLPPELRNIAFVERAPWSQTHQLKRFHEHTGYLMLTPNPR